jgi:hypothetical protein
MQVRTGYLGPRDTGGLVGFKAAYKEFCEEHSHGTAEIDLIFYSTVFQAGVDRFLIDDFCKEDFAPLAVERVKILKPETLYRCWSPIVFFFRDDLLHKETNNKQLKRIVWFLSDLYVCMATNSCKINTLEIPSPEPLLGTKYEILFEPLSLVLKQLAPHPTPTPTPTSTLSHDSLKRLEDIMTGKLFLAIKNAHIELEDLGMRVGTSLAKIESESKRLVLRYPELLKLSSASLSLLRASPKIIDLAFGKLAGVLGETFFEITDKFFKREKNIVIYHSGGILRNQLRFVLNNIASQPKKQS